MFRGDAMLVVRMVLVLMLLHVGPGAPLGAEAAGAPDCNCNYGAVDQTEPRCVCACFSGYFMPDCLYKADSAARIEIWFNKPVAEFVSAEVTTQLETALGADPAINFLSAIENKNKTNALFSMSGLQAKNLRYDVDVQQRYVIEMGVEAVYPYVLSLAPRAEFMRKVVIYSDSTVGEVTVETVGWLIGALCVVVFGVCIETCCSRNTEQVIYNVLEEEGWIEYEVPGPQGQPPERRRFVLCQHRGKDGRKCVNPLQAPPHDYDSEAP